MTEQESGELAPSELGTLVFWENAYAQELDNFRDHGDVGEIWFGAGNSRKVVRWIATKLNLDKENDKIIDVGCGNAMTLVELANEGFADLTGVDYSQKAVDLARMVLNDNNLSNVKLEVCDILNNTLSCDFKVVHDKGTYDAISLSPDDPAAKRQTYVENIHRIISPGGYLVLTSCNWTKEELLRHFTNHFELESQLPTDTFQFGGQTGNTITQLVFKKK
ncbi:EEF1A lysine methyltransferase 2 isoform X1 [Odontomachus brunneus]|uniref:EEF1A lysine methyltransferase 2 isoform X1 n=1 Tax=Odontomachus brunneus TaxID=486640 RepID=UPI0013F27D89|nr:EEF1A lysine methyltransferase 2 isoform X1 [Odontomachus brunneus]